jgi:hypothetical protein
MTGTAKQESMMVRYRAALRAYGDAAATLSRFTGADFEEAYSRAEKARLDFEAIRAELRASTPAREGQDAM